MKKIQPSISLLLIGSTMLLFIMAFAAFKIESSTANTTDWLREKKAMTIACGLDDATVKQQGKSNTHENDGPANKSNGCAHSFAAGALCNISGPKRQLMKNHSC